MKSNTTAIWFVLAAVLAAAVWFVDKQLQPALPSDNTLLAGLHAGDVTAIQVIPVGMREISVSRTNKDWFLGQPVAYPAQNAAVESLLSVLEKLSPTVRLTAAETSHKDADAEFGLDNPQFRVDITAGDQSWHLNIGNKTAPGDGVYVRLVGGAGVYVTDVNWLSLLPHDAGSWRSSTVVGDLSTVDWIIITNGTKSIELRRDATNQIWRMIRPLQARADGAYITAALQQLRTAKVTRFVTDDPKADLTTFGLAPVQLDVWLGHGTNFLDALHAGKDSADDPGQLYARREGWNSVVTTPKDAIQPWHGDVNDFRDPHLLSFTAPVAEAVAEIEVQSQDGDFRLQHQGANPWTVAGEKFPMDMENLQLFVRLLAGLRVAEFRKNAVTGTDLQDFGLAPTNSRSITLRSTAGDTNAVIAQLIFGATETNKVFVKRGDEDFVYTLALADVNQLPQAGWQFRDRRIWNFSATNVTQITLRQAGLTRQIVHEGVNKWSLAPGSQGMVDPLWLEQAAEQFGSLTTPGWIGRNFTEPEKFGLNTNNLEIVFELKNGQKLAVDFGTSIPSPTAPTRLAAVTLDGDRWAFVFPPVIYPLIDPNLTLAPGAP